MSDIFAVFNNEAASMEFLYVLNSQYKNLQFTIEKSTNTLPFLDMELKIHNSNLQIMDLDKTDSYWSFSEF